VFIALKFEERRVGYGKEMSCVAFFCARCCIELEGGRTENYIV
jgi:hypothetical protein